MSIFKLSSLALCGAVSLSVHADDAVERMQVVASRDLRDAASAAADVRVISADDLQRGGYTSLVQALATEAGIQMTDSIGHGGRGVGFGLRGFVENSGNNVLVLVDGRRLNTPSLAGPDLEGLLIADIERIEILFGGAGALYGDQATAGVIRVVTRKAAAQKRQLLIARGSDDLERYAARMPVIESERFVATVSGEKRMADHYRDNNQQALQQGRVQAEVRDTDWTLSLESQRMDDALRLPGALTLAQIAANRRQSTTPGNFGDTQRELDALNGVLRTGNWRWSLDVSRKQEEGRGSFWGSPYRFDGEQTRAQPRFTLDLAGLPGATLSAGLDQENAQHQADYGFGVTDARQDLQDAYLQFALPFAERWHLDAAARRSAFDFHLRSTGLRYEDKLSAWSVGAVRRLSAGRIFARADAGFRWPNVDENGFVSPGVTHLRPQQHESFETGWVMQGDAGETSLSAFVLDVEDELVFDPTANGPWGPGTGANINLDAAHRKGASLATRWQLSPSLRLRGDYSYTDARLRGGLFAGKRAPFTAQDRISAALDWQWAAAWQMHVDAQYTGPRFRSGDRANRGAEMGGFTVLNAALQWTLDSVTVLARINNLGGKRYLASAGGLPPADYAYPAAQRSGEVQLKWAF